MTASTAASGGSSSPPAGAVAPGPASEASAPYTTPLYMNPPGLCF